MSLRLTGCGRGTNTDAVGNDPVSGEEGNDDLEHQVEAEMGDNGRHPAAAPVQSAEDHARQAVAQHDEDENRGRKSDQEVSLREMQRKSL
jgi:hypothetical protein